jgi:hypothetical protein
MVYPSRLHFEPFSLGAFAPCWRARRYGLGFRVEGLGLRVKGVGFRVLGLGFRV